MGPPPAQPCVGFDLDGLIVDSDPLWVARKVLVRPARGRRIAEAETATELDRLRATGLRITVV
jgi:hypothetical protein